MLLTDDESAELKKWVVKKLEDMQALFKVGVLMVVAFANNSSDADSDVLADYVLALIRADTPDDDLKKNAVENLEDFLRDNTANFVDEIFNTINTKSYMPGYVLPPFSGFSAPGFDVARGSTRGPYGQLGARGGFNGNANQSRKRSYNDRQGNGDGSDSHYGRGDRSIKQLRRGRGGRGDNSSGGADYFGGRGGRGGGIQEHNFPMGGIPGLGQSPPISFLGMPPPPSGFPFDPNDPMRVIMTAQAMGFPPLPGMPPFPQAGSPTGLQQPGGQRSPGSDMPAARKIRERCRDYDTRGFCTRGSACPYKHGMDHIVVPGQQDEYDPKNAVMMDIQKTPNGTNGHSSFDNNRGKGRGRGRGDRGGLAPNRRGRAEFSHAGPNHDRSISTIVVEQIPEDKFDEQSVREFFSEFGNILEVTMQAYKRLAI
ncbi:MAG: hypothetical protein M1830_008324, partial [Pleopsidium flavum]